MESYLMQKGIPFIRMPLPAGNTEEFYYEDGFDIRPYVTSPCQYSHPPSPVPHTSPSPRQFFTNSPFTNIRNSPFMNQWNVYRPPMSPMTPIPQNQEVFDDKRNVFEKLGKTFPFPPYNVKNQKNFMVFIRSPQCLHWLELSWSIACFIVYGNQKAEKCIHELNDGEIFELTRRAPNSGLISVHLRQNKNSDGFNGDIVFSSEIVAKNFIDYGKKQLSIDFNFPPNQAFLKIEWHNESIYGKRHEIKTIKNDETNEQPKKIIFEINKNFKKEDIQADSIISPSLSIRNEDCKDSPSSDSISSPIFRKKASPFKIYDKKMSEITEINIGEESKPSFISVIKKPQFLKIDTMMENVNLTKPTFITEDLPKPIAIKDEKPNKISIDTNSSRSEIEFNLFDDYIKRIVREVKKLSSNIEGIKKELLENYSQKSYKYNLTINEKLEYQSNGKNIILHLSEIINNPSKHISFFKKLQSELKVISSELYFHIYSKNIENNFILEISKKF